MRRTISGKNFSNGQVTDVVFEWDGPVTIPINPGPTTGKRENIQGQKIDLHQLSQQEKHVFRPQSAPSRPVPDFKKRNPTPPPTRTSKPDNKQIVVRGGDISRPVHVPGSTVPHMRTGSKRTQEAATWLASEQTEVSGLHVDMNSDINTLPCN
jgi:hypothetical protein